MCRRTVRRRYDRTCDDHRHRCRAPADRDPPRDPRTGAPGPRRAVVLLALPRVPVAAGLRRERRRRGAGRLRGPPRRGLPRRWPASRATAPWSATRSRRTVPRCGCATRGWTSTRRWRPPGRRCPPGATPAPLTRAAVCLEIVDAINKRSFEIANAVMHTSGQPFVMSFQAGGPHAQDRALEAIVGALVEQERVPASVVWEKPAKGEPLRMQKDYRIVPRGVALVIGCNTFPTWNGYPGLFASLATGNAGRRQAAPARGAAAGDHRRGGADVLEASRLRPRPGAAGAPRPTASGWPGRWPSAPRSRSSTTPAAPASATGSSARRRPPASRSTPRSPGVNSIVIDSTDNLRGVLGNLAFSLSLYSGQMCTTPQNIYVPARRHRHRRGPPVLRGGRRQAGRGAHPVHRRRRQGGRDPRRDGQRRRARPGRLAARRWPRRSAAPSSSTAAGSTHPTYPDAVVRTPGLVAVDVAGEDSAYTLECFGPVSFLIATDGTAQSLQVLRDTIREHGAMTAAVYSTSEDVLDAARDAAADCGVALSREPHRPGVRQPDRGVQRLPRHRRQPGGQLRLRRRGVRRQPVPRGHLPPPRLTPSPLPPTGRTALPEFGHSMSGFGRCGASGRGGGRVSR